MFRLRLPRVAVAAAAAALVGAALIGGTPLTARAAAPVTCPTTMTAATGGPGYIKCSGKIPVKVGPSTTDCNMDADLYLPDPQPAAKEPAILTTNGFGGTKDDQSSLGAYATKHGYAVLSYSGLGFGNSNEPGVDCKIQLDRPAYDGMAAKQLITWLADTANVPDIKLDATGDPRVGMIGGSYGGAIQFATASIDPRLDAIIPIITWNDLGYSLAPQNANPSSPYDPNNFTLTDSPPGVSKFEWTELFFADGVATPVMHPPSTVPTSQFPCPGFPNEVCVADGDTITHGYPSTTTLQLLHDASMVGYDQHGEVHIPTMLLQGEADTLFNLDEAVANYELIKKTGAPVKLVLQSWGHSHSEPLKGEFTTNGHDPSGLYETGLIQHWFDKYLMGDASIDTGPAVEYYRDYADDGSGTPASIGRAYGSASGYPIAPPFALYPSADGTLRTRATGITAGAPAMVNPPAGEPASYSETSGVQDSKSLPFFYIPATDPPGESVSFTTAPLTRAANELGIPTLKVTVNAPVSSNADAAFQPELFTKIYDVAPDGTSTSLPERLVSPARIPGGLNTVTLTLPGIIHQFAGGHHIRLTIAATDQAYIGSKLAGPITFPIDPAAPDVLLLPIGDGPTTGIQNVQAASTGPTIPVPDTGAEGASGGTALTLLTLGGLALRRRRRSH
ncbi:MAG: alpha/beta fold hydrolase [Candidatus Dormibacteria bacterium]